jgi:hypothetical protein
VGRCCIVRKGVKKGFLEGYPGISISTPLRRYEADYRSPMTLHINLDHSPDTIYLDYRDGIMLFDLVD